MKTHVVMLCIEVCSVSAHLRYQSASEMSSVNNVDV